MSVTVNTFDMPTISNRVGYGSMGKSVRSFDTLFAQALTQSQDIDILNIQTYQAQLTSDLLFSFIC